MTFELFRRKYDDKRFLEDLKKLLIKYLELFYELVYEQHNQYFFQHINRVKSIRSLDELFNYIKNVDYVGYFSARGRYPKIAYKILKQFQRACLVVLVRAKILRNSEVVGIVQTLINQLKLVMNSEGITELVRNNLGFLPQTLFDDYVSRL